MACSERSEELILALLADELGPAERAEVDEHLLGCSACWRAVQEDRAGAMALEQLREAAPPGLAGRVRLAVTLGDLDGERAEQVAPGPPVARPGPAAATQRLARLLTRRGARQLHGSRRLAALAAAACLLAAALVGGLAASLGGSQPSDPPVVIAVTAMAGPGQPGPARLAATHTSETLEVSGQRIVVDAYRVDGVLTVVARSARPFAMPAFSSLMQGSSSKAWMASRGPVGLWCLNAPRGGYSMLVAARMPAVQLPAALAKLHLSTL